MHLGVQRFHATIHHLGKTRELVYGSYGNTGLLEHFCSAAGTNNLDAKFIDKRPGKFFNARLVGKRYDGSFDFGILHCAPLPL